MSMPATLLSTPSMICPKSKPQSTQNAFFVAAGGGVVVATQLLFVPLLFVEKGGTVVFMSRPNSEGA